MPGPLPKEHRARPRAEKTRALGDWQPTTGIGWQHSAKHPPCPTGLETESRIAWKVWMGSWMASHWSPDDLPGLRQVIRLYDRVERGEFQRVGELRLHMDAFGLTPKGALSLRWKPPDVEKAKAADKLVPQAYGHLKAVDRPGGS